MEERNDSGTIGLLRIESIIILAAAAGCWYFISHSNFGGAAATALIAICMAIESGAIMIALEIRRHADRFDRKQP